MGKFQLAKLDVSVLRNADFASFMERFFEDFSKASLNIDTDADFKRVFEKLQEDLQVYKTGLDQVRASEESSRIAKYDVVRDADFQAIKDALKPYRKSSKQSEKEAYTALNLLLTEYKGVEKNNYETQTIRLTNLVERLQSETYKKAVKELAIERFITRLAESNLAFKKIFSERSIKNLQKPSYNVKELRKNLTSDYRMLVNYVLSLAQMKEEVFYKETLSVINNGRKYFADIILARRTNKKSTEKVVEAKENSNKV